MNFVLSQTQTSEPVDDLQDKSLVKNDALIKLKYYF
jgi:hypothetical protein